MSDLWHEYPDVHQDPVPAGAVALCGHVAEVETDRPIGPDDERCPVCVALLDEDLDEGPQPCVRCKRLFDPDEMNCPDEGLMCESCFDATYGG